MKSRYAIRLMAGIIIAAVTLIVPIAGMRWWWQRLAVNAKADPARVQSYKAKADTPRFRYYYVAAQELKRGHQVNSRDLEFRVSRSIEGEEIIQIPDDILGSFVTSQNITRGQVLKRSQFRSAPLIVVPPGGTVVPVEVSQNHISGLRPGMRLAFVDDKGMSPDDKDLKRKNAGPTFLLLSISTSAQDKNVASLLVAVEKCRMPLVQKIANGTKRPVIVQDVP